MGDINKIEKLQAQQQLRVVAADREMTCEHVPIYEGLSSCVSARTHVITPTMSFIPVHMCSNCVVACLDSNLFVLMILVNYNYGTQDFYERIFLTLNQFIYVLHRKLKYRYTN